MARINRGGEGGKSCCLQVVMEIRQGESCAADKTVLALLDQALQRSLRQRSLPKQDEIMIPIGVNGRFPTDIGRGKISPLQLLEKYLEISIGKCRKEERKEQCL